MYRYVQVKKIKNYKFLDSKVIRKVKKFASNVHFLFTFLIQKRRENSNRVKSCLPRSVKSVCILTWLINMSLKVPEILMKWSTKLLLIAICYAKTLHFHRKIVDFLKVEIDFSSVESQILSSWRNMNLCYVHST